jgi:hypothetical protein
MGRTLKQIEVLDHRDLTNCQLFKMSFACGSHDTSVLVPDSAGYVQKWLIRYFNAFAADNPYRLLFAILVGGINGVMGSLTYMLARAPDYAGGPDSWIRFIPVSIFVIGFLLFHYLATVFWLKAGGNVVIVEAYKRGVVEKAAKRAAERRKQYRPISAQELES